jgi:hypothetical protein
MANIKSLLNDRWNAFEQSRKIADDPEFWQEELKSEEDQDDVCSSSPLFCLGGLFLRPL